MWFLQKLQTKGYDFLLQLFSKEIFRFNSKNDLFSPILQKRKCINNDKVNFFSPLSNVLDHDCVCKFYDCYYYQRERLSRCSRFRGRFFSFCVREQCNTCNNKLLFPLHSVSLADFIFKRKLNSTDTLRTCNFIWLGHQQLQFVTNKICAAHFKTRFILFH